VAEKSISDTAGKSAPEKKKSAKLTTVSVMCLLAVLRESERASERERGGEILTIFPAFQEYQAAGTFSSTCKHCAKAKDAHEKKEGEKKGAFVFTCVSISAICFLVLVLIYPLYRTSSIFCLKNHELPSRFSYSID